MRRNRFALFLACVIGGLTGWAAIWKWLKVEDNPTYQVIGVASAFVVAFVWEAIDDLLEHREEKKRFPFFARLCMNALVLIVLETLVGASELVGEAAESYNYILHHPFYSNGHFAPALPHYLATLIAVWLGASLYAGFCFYVVIDYSLEKNWVGGIGYAIFSLFYWCLGFFYFEQYQPIFLASALAWIVAIGGSIAIKALDSRPIWIPVIVFLSAVGSGCLAAYVGGERIAGSISATEQKDMRNVFAGYSRLIASSYPKDNELEFASKEIARVSQLPVWEQMLEAHKVLSGVLYDRNLGPMNITPQDCDKDCDKAFQSFMEVRKNPKSENHLFGVGGMFPLLAGGLTFWIVRPLAGLLYSIERRKKGI